MADAQVPDKFIVFGAPDMQQPEIDEVVARPFALDEDLDGLVVLEDGDPRIVVAGGDDHLLVHG
jgi:hypothetical protein